MPHGRGGGGEVERTVYTKNRLLSRETSSSVLVEGLGGSAPHPEFLTHTKKKKEKKRRGEKKKGENEIISWIYALAAL